MQTLSHWSTNEEEINKLIKTRWKAFQLSQFSLTLNLALCHGAQQTHNKKIAQFFRNSPTTTSNLRFEIRTKNYPNFSIALHREWEKNSRTKPCCGLWIEWKNCWKWKIQLKLALTIVASRIVLRGIFACEFLQMVCAWELPFRWYTSEWGDYLLDEVLLCELFYGGRGRERTRIINISVNYTPTPLPQIIKSDSKYDFSLRFSSIKW